MVKKIDDGYVPPKKPAKPAGGGQRGYVPQKLPVKPPTKQSSNYAGDVAAPVALVRQVG